MKNKKIYIAGHKGLVGSAIKRYLEQSGYTNLIYRTHTELDLTNTQAVNHFFEQEKPDWVFLAAAKVGGIYSNSKYPVEFMLENLKIQNNIIENCYKHHIEKLMFLGSSCIYPKNTPQPIQEKYLLSDYLEPTNEGYALAKICGLKLCHYYNKEYGTDFMSVMPCNLYGINDSYHDENAHVIPMLIQRFHKAKINQDPQVVVWGTGTPKREFLYSDDLAAAVVLLMETKNASDIGECVNIGATHDISIATLAELIKETVGYTGQLIYDTSKPDGTMKKKVDISKITSLGWKQKTSLEEGLKIAYKDYLSKYTKD